MSTRRNRPRVGRSAFTLLELLVAMSISLVMLYAVIKFLEYVGDTVSDGRAMIELSGQLRAVRQRLHNDLRSLTVPVRPYADVGGAPGYFMIYEGPRADQDRDGNGTIDADLDADGQPDFTPSALALSPWGDYDDVIAFTIHSKKEPLMGRTPPNAMSQAESAEVIWYCGWDDVDNDNVPDDGEMRWLFRRQLLVDPTLVPTPANFNSSYVSTPSSSITYSATGLATGDALQGLRNFQMNFDLSVHLEPQYDSKGVVTSFTIVGNTLADLARRENRYGFGWLTGNRPVDGFPNPLDLNPNDQVAINRYRLQNNRLGEDMQLSRCVAWDVRVYDPLALVVQQTYGPSDLDAAGPSDRLIDPATAPGSNATSSGYGAFVDLNYSRYASLAKDSSGNTMYTFFSGLPNSGSQLGGAIYDTWSMTYERDGINQDGDAIYDEQSNGIDDAFPPSVNPADASKYPIQHNNSTMGNIRYNGADDPSERETSPPYETPLRGVQVIIRVFDPSTRQMRQATVVADFTPE